ncbi:MAG TPA: IPT/TIG domain-containing protein [Bacteroidota bacterium]|nr:IPT/TIG domain-containing protein [Bacteroidota bacterium]
MNTSMMLHRTLVSLMAIAVAGGLFMACEEDPPASLYDPGRTGGLTPTIVSIAPSDSALAGVTTIVITGTNFSATPTDNLAFFNASQATILQATTTQLTVRAPVLIGDAISLKVTVLGAELFSNVVQYKLVAAVSQFGAGATTEVPSGITCDNQGNVFVSLQTEAGVGLGIKRITPAGVRSDFGGLGAPSWSGLKIGPADTLFAVRNLAAIYRIPQTGTPVIWRSIGTPGSPGILDFDFDQELNLWAAGSRDSLYRLTRSKNVKSFPFPGNIRAVRVFQNFLYIGGLVYAADTLEKIVRFPIISSDSLGPAEFYFNFSEAFPIPSKPRVNALTFAANGDLFVGTDSVASTIVIVHPDGTAEPFYPGLLSGQAVSFGYGIGPELYVSTTGSVTAHKRILRINTERLGAPYYGRQ